MIRVAHIEEDVPRSVRSWNGRTSGGRAGPSQGAFASDAAEKSIFDRFDDGPPAGRDVGSYGAGPARRTRGGKRASPYGYTKSDPDTVATWKHDMYQGPTKNVMSSVFVRNLPPNINEGQLRSLFTRQGIPVASVKMDKGTQIPTATVYFERRDHAAMAEDLDGWEIGRNRIKVAIMDEERQYSNAVDEPTPRNRRKGRGFAAVSRQEEEWGGPKPAFASHDKHVSIFDRMT